MAQAPVLVRQVFPGAVITCGGISAKPGVYNVVPNEVTLFVEYRAAELETLEGIEVRLLELAEEVTAAEDDLSFTANIGEGQSPVALNPAVGSAGRQACEALGVSHLPLSSGALHDAGILSSITPAGLIFVPSIGGRSHCPEENTSAADLITGANVLLHTALIFSRKHGEDDE